MKATAALRVFRLHMNVISVFRFPQEPVQGNHPSICDEKEGMDRSGMQVGYSSHTANL
jgi:hypothetical protein